MATKQYLDFQGLTTFKNRLDETFLAQDHTLTDAEIEQLLKVIGEGGGDVEINNLLYQCEVNEANRTLTISAYNSASATVDLGDLTGFVKKSDNGWDITSSEEDFTIGNQSDGKAYLSFSSTEKIAVSEVPFFPNGGASPEMQFKQVLDLTSSIYDQNTWYPCVTNQKWFTTSMRTIVDVHLSDTGNPTWATHERGFSVYMDVENLAEGWGTYYGCGVCHCVMWKFTVANPCGFRVMTNSSKNVVYCRGGGKYTVYANYPLDFSIKTSTYTMDGQSVSPVTTAPHIQFSTNAYVQGVPMVSNYIPYNNPTDSSKTQGTFQLLQNQVANTDTYYLAHRRDTDRIIGFGIGSGGQNMGVLNFSSGGWMLYADDSNNVHLRDQAYKQITPTMATNVTAGGYQFIYQIGRLVVCALNFNISAAITSSSIMSGLPKPVVGTWAGNVSQSNGVSCRIAINQDGNIIPDGAMSTTGWYNGNLIYLANTEV